MYMRFVQVKVKPEMISEVYEHYDDTVIPTLQKVNGCLYACLIRSEHHDDECISMTLWEDRRDAEAYEQSGVFSELLRQAAPHLADSSEWRIHLSEDLKLEYEPVPLQPEVNAFDITAEKNSHSVPHGQSLFVRIVSPQIREGKIDEFRKIYTEEVLPALRTVPQCRYAYLTENVKERNQLLSVTIWDSHHDAEVYEQSGVFSALIDRLKHTFSEVYQWKMQLQKEAAGQVVTSQDLSVEGYSVVTGKSFL
jgi:quinol monooxygenase YgiN